MKTYITAIFLLAVNLFAVDFSKDISPIIYTNCTTCHRQGEIGSFLQLTGYENVYANRDWIADAISGEGSEHTNPIMPPWPADREYSTLIGERYLREDQINTVLNWITEGAPQGDPELEYPMPDWPTGSAIGVPDEIIEMEEAYFIEGNFEDDYRCFVLDTDFAEDKDIAAIEFRPGNSEAVHHALIIAVPNGAADQNDQTDPGYGYQCFGGFGVSNTSDLLGGYAPGMLATEWPSGLGQSIPANSDLIVQIHYAPTGMDQFDQSSINIFFKEEAVERYVQEEVMINFTFMLPPGQITEVSETWTINQDISLVQFLPHCHLLGQSWEIYAVTPSNETIPIISIPDWDFDWQLFYSPEYMLHLPAQTTIYATCIYNNTTNNWVFWGEGTEDEMFFLPIRYVPYQAGDESVYLGPDEQSTASVSFQTGWNLVGLPLEVDDPSYGTLFPDAIAGTLFSYDNGGGYISEENLVSGDGYWLRFPSESSITVNGSAYHEVTISLYEGWNLTAGPSLMSEISDPENIVIPGTLFGWNPGYTEANYLEPGKGYWVRASGDGDITISSYWQPRIDMSSTLDLTNDANLLELRNSDGSVSKLYFFEGSIEDFLNSEEHQLSYSLPPIPPPGAFDARFTGDWRIGGEGSVIQVQNDQWPLIVSLKQGERNKELGSGSWVLVDKSNGIEYVLNENSTVEITKPTNRLTLYRRSLTPEHFALHQNYPNPFNPSTTVEFSVETQSITSLQIYDIKGRLVETLVSDNLVPGLHSVEWNASNVSSGVYIYKLISGSNQITKKMILLK